MTDVERKLNVLEEKVDRLADNLEGFAKYKGYTVKKEDDDPTKLDWSKDENEDRGNWTGKADFLLACLGYAVGLGNVWRFPYLCYSNGGAVFFIPYVIMLTIVGVPIFFLELSLGQFTSSSPLTCWNMARIFKGVGVGMIIVSGLVGIYYNMIIAWAIYYLFSSFTSDLPWQHCDREWNTEFCSLRLEGNIDWDNCTGYANSIAAENGVCYRYNESYSAMDIGYANSTYNFEDNSNLDVFGFWNETLANKKGLKSVLPSEEYFNRRATGKDFGSLENMGKMKWELVLCLLAAWIIVFFSLVNGVKSSGKVVYFTALFPYAVLIILFIRGMMLDGMEEGIKFYILTPDLTKLQNAKVWKDAAVQIFFSLSASWGGLIALSSYNRFHTNCLRDSLIVSIGNCLTSFFAGFVVFSFLGFLAKANNKNVADVVESGVGLAFIVYPDAVTRMPVSPLWAILFFIMLITLGLDSEFALIETVTTSIMDQWPGLRKKKWLVILITCIIGFILGLSLCTEGGTYMLTLLDTYSGGWNVMLIALLECICVAYVYGFMRYREDVRTMIGNDPCCCFPWSGCSWYWAVTWYALTPLAVLFIMIFSWVDYERLTYGSYEYPLWGDALGWLMTFAVIAGIVITPLVLICQVMRNGEGVKSLFVPNRYWGPVLPKHRKLMERYLSPGTFELDPFDTQEMSPDDIEMADAKKAGYSPNGTDNTGFDGERF